MKNIPSIHEQLEPLAFDRVRAAKKLGISVQSLDRLCRRGLIRPSRALRKPLFTKGELQRFLAETRSEGAI
jgi:hypothetical protein